MPIEHEHKIILKDAEALHATLGRERFPMSRIEQFYLSENARFRRISHGPAPDSPDMEHTFTYKQWIGGRLLEIETSITAADFLIAREAARGSLVKDRFKAKDRDGHQWDIDFLFTARPEEGGELYFAMAEIETDEGASWAMLPILEPHVAVVVPREHNRLFTNSRLTDQGYAARMLREVLLGMVGSSGRETQAS